MILRLYNKLYDKLPLIFLIILLIASFILMVNAARDDAAIFDEPAHLAAGYSYIRYFDYRLNPEHPPLIKALAALPLLFLNLKFPLDNPAWSQVNQQFIIGRQFLYESGNNADQIIFWARIPPILITLLTTLLIYFWSKELLGRWWALLPAFFFSLSPTVLAHGHYVTTDVGATLGVILATFTFLKFLLKPTARQIVLAGLALGTAQLTKFSNTFLIPYFILVTLIFLISLKVRNQEIPLKWKSYFLKTFLVFFIGYLLVYAVYFLFTFHYPQEKQLTDVTTLFSYPQNQSLLADIELKMIKSNLLRPFGQYFLGLLMTIKRLTNGTPVYFLGEFSTKGWWYYFPLVFLMKEPLPSLILILLALGFGLKIFISKLITHYSLLKSFANYLGTHLAEFSMLLFIIIYWGYSIQSPLNIGLRYLLPTLPFIYILSVSGLKTLLQSQKTKVLKILVITILTGWYLGETIFTAPYFLSYFNETGGGTFNGYQYVTDSNFDWGQDLKRLKIWVEKNLPPDARLAVDYFGGGNPQYYLGDKAESWWSARGHPQKEGIKWLAVSAHLLQIAWAKLQPDLKRKPEDEYSWLKNIKPFDRAGTSIFIYRF